MVTVKKAIAQIYYGAAIMSGEQGSVQEIIEHSCQCANFVHCTANQLNLIMEKTSLQYPQDLFFFRVDLISAFVARPPSLLGIL
jgi:hypothetical protein